VIPHRKIPNTIPDGYTDLAPGKIASVVTYLEMLERPRLPDVSEHESESPLVLRRVPNPELAWYRDLMRRAGAQWVWFSRLAMNDDQLAALLHCSTTEVYLVEVERREIGMAELDRSESPNVEIASFALFAEAIGKGFGRAFMTSLLIQAWDESATRIWLHTCTLDSPTALGFYIKCGFHPYKRAIEVADDPRLRGILPEDAAPQVPLLR
jgi:GNAT superfamily N-acetyltransferase